MDFYRENVWNGRVFEIHLDVGILGLDRNLNYLTRDS